MPTTILWLRRDLRRHDLPALNAAAAAAEGGAVLPLFVVDPELMATAGPVRGRCLRDALEAVRAAYDDALVLRHGDATEVVPDLARKLGARSVHISGEVHPYGRRRDDLVRERLRSGGVDLIATGTPYAVDPGSVRKNDGDPFKVFTPFSHAWRDHGWDVPAPPVQPRWCRSIDNLDLPDVPEDAEVDLPPCTEGAALERWEEFCDVQLPGYARDRDRPDRDGTSLLSMHLKFGTIHPRTLLADLAGRRGEGADRFITELCWREFYADVLHHRPETAWKDLRPELANMVYDDPEADDEVREHVEAWCAGRTGYPVVDAAMRHLRREGWMPNRLRMVTASFLTKDLHVWWPHGARHFLHWLRDGDVASNNHNWQWVAGTGTDAAPYFRIFNPVTQGQRFDPDGAYVRRWVPELSHLGDRAAHAPWDAEDGYAHGYPQRIVDHADERREALRRHAQARE